MTIPLLSNLFLLLSGLMALAIIALLSRYLANRARIAAIGGFAVWLLYVTILGYTGVVASPRLPGPALLLGPVLLFVLLFLSRHPGVRQFARTVPAPLLIGLQLFRVFVELALFELSTLHLIPRLLTFEGANFDILIGLTALPVAYLYATGRISPTAVRIWSVAGIALLANVVVRALLTVPGPLHLIQTDVPNTAILHFPFTYLPGLLVPIALCLHVLLLRALPHTHNSKE